MRAASGRWSLPASRCGSTATELEALSKKRPSRKLRKQMKGIIDTLGLKAADPAVRIDSAIKMGRSQKAGYVSALEQRLALEPDTQVQQALREALAISLLANGTGEAVRSAVEELEAMKSIPARAFIEVVLKAEQEGGREQQALALACEQAKNH